LAFSEYCVFNISETRHHCLYYFNLQHPGTGALNPLPLLWYQWPNATCRQCCTCTTQDLPSLKFWHMAGKGTRKLTAYQI